MMETGQWIIIGISVFLAGWYLVFNIYNRRRGIATYYWLRSLLSEIGSIHEASWLGSSSSGARLMVTKAHKPFHHVEAICLLETRELLPWWIFQHLRGRRDAVILRGSLQRAPYQTFTIRKMAGKIKPGNSGIDIADRYQPLLKDFFIDRNVEQGDLKLEGLLNFLTANYETVRRVSISRETPHFEIELKILPLLSTSPQAFIESLQTWLQKS